MVEHALAPVRASAQEIERKVRLVSFKNMPICLADQNFTEKNLDLLTWVS